MFNIANKSHMLSNNNENDEPDATEVKEIEKKSTTIQKEPVKESITNLRKKRMQSYKNRIPTARSFSPPPRKKPCSRQTSRDERQNEKTDELPTSFIYIERPGGKIYKLEFKSKYPRVTPMYVHPRKASLAENEKSVQPVSKEGLIENYNLQTSRLCTLRRTYKLVDVDDKNDEEFPEGAPKAVNSAPTSANPSPHRKDDNASPHSLRVYQIEKFAGEDENVARVKRSNTDGAVYVEYNGYILKIRCEMQSLASLRAPSEKDIQLKLERLKMEPTSHRKNKAELWTRCGNDLLKVQFDMEDVKMTKMELKEEIGLQTASNLIYIRDISPITGKTNYIAIPETTYLHYNPMPAINRVHLRYMNTNAIPLWKYEMMQERLAAKRGVYNVQDAHDKLFMRTRGSRMLFEAFDALAAINMGMLCSEVLRGQEIYESERRSEWNEQLNAKRRNRTKSPVPQRAQSDKQDLKSNPTDKQEDHSQLTSPSADSNIKADDPLGEKEKKSPKSI